MDEEVTFDGQSQKLPQYTSSCQSNVDSPSFHMDRKINPTASRFPHSIVWTPLPVITWLLPFIGHMGICTTHGVIRDFAGPYYVSEDDMAFGQPTKYWQLDVESVGFDVWDRSVYEASEVYKTRMHNLCCDNCHSHVAMALNLMKYKGSSSWNMVKLCFLMLIHGKYVSVCGFLKTWLPFLLMSGAIVTISLVVHFKVFWNMVQAVMYSTSYGLTVTLCTVLVLCRLMNRVVFPQTVSRFQAM